MLLLGVFRHSYLKNRMKARFPSRRIFEKILLDADLYGSGLNTGSMSHVPNGRDLDGESDSGEDVEPRVPFGVLRGIEDIGDGNTADKDDLESVLKF